MTKKAKPPTPRQLEQQKRVLLHTRKLLAEEGYEGLQMRVLAERASVAPMTLYNRFGNKDDLILAALQELLAELAVRVNASGKQGIELIVHNAGVIADQILDTPRYAKAMALMLFNGQPDSPIVQTLLQTSFEQALSNITEMQDHGELTNEVGSKLLARGLSAAGWSTILLWMKRLIPDSEFKEEYTRAPLLLLAPAMSQAAKVRYADRLH